MSNENRSRLSFRRQICNIIFHFGDHFAVISFSCVHVNIPQALNILLLVAGLGRLNSESVKRNLELYEMIIKQRDLEVFITRHEEAT